MNELVTSTVFDLFSNTEKIAIECKPKVRELEGLLKQENSSRRNSLNNNDSFSLISEGSARDSSSSRTEKIVYKSVAEWMEKEAPKRLKEAFKKLGLEEGLTKSSKRVEL